MLGVQRGYNKTRQNEEKEQLRTQKELRVFGFMK